MSGKKIVYPIFILSLLLMLMGWEITPHSSIEKEKKLEYSAETTMKKRVPTASTLIDASVKMIYEESLLGNEGLSYPLFRSAYIGFLNLQTAEKIPSTASVLSIADFSVSSKKKRLWIVDLVKKELLLNTWVSHGRGSGGEMATQFSNTMSSHQSSLGFYVTGEVYSGKHGRSLRLDGMDVGFNHKARERAIVIHGASYVSAQAIKNLNRLGLSHGCPAVPSELSNKIIDLVKNKTVLFINADVANYNSKYLDEELAGNILLAGFLEDNSNSQYGNL